MSLFKPPSFIRDINGHAVGIIGDYGLVRDTMRHTVGCLHSNTLVDIGGREVGRFERFAYDDSAPHFRTDAGMLRDSFHGSVRELFEPEPERPYRYEPPCLLPRERMEPCFEPVRPAPIPLVRYEPLQLLREDREIDLAPKPTLTFLSNLERKRW